MRSSATALVRLGRGFTFGLIAACALAAGPPLRAQTAQPGPAAKSAAIHRLLQERAAETSPLARAAVATLDALGAVRDRAAAATAGSAAGKPAVDPDAVRMLGLEIQNLRNAYDELQRVLASGPALPKGAFAPVEKVIDLGDALSGNGPRGRQVALAQTVEQIGRQAAKALGTLKRDPPRPVRVIENPVPAVRRTPVELGSGGATGTSAAPAVVQGVGISSGTTVTPDIDALAAQLDHDPLKIYEYVRNNFRFETYFGFLKGAQATLETRAGNDYDLAVLTGALLQASGYNIRYGRGTANIPAQAMTDWLGLEDPAAANVILNTAGINAVPVVNGSVIDHYRVDRFWVEVETTQRPGGVPEWFPLDTAFKRHDLSPGVPGLLATVPFDEATYLSDTRTELTWEFYEDQIRSWLSANMPGTTADDVPLGMTVVPESLGALPRSLPYTLYSLDAIYSSIPSTLMHKATIRVVYLGGNEFSDQIVLPDTSLQRITVSWAVNPADQSIVDGYGGLANTPPGAVDVIPELKLDGVMVAQGGLVPYLATVTIQTDFYKPEGDIYDGTSTHTVRAGEWAAIGIDAFQISDALLQRQAKTVVDATALLDGGGTPDPDDLIGAFLYLAIMQYHHDVRAGDAVTTGLVHYRQVVQVSEGAALADQEIISVGGTPFTTLPGALTVDVPRLDRSSFALDDDNTLGPQLRRITGDNGSAQEHALWEGFLNVPGISTIKSLQIANVSAIPVFVIDDSDSDPNNDCSVLCPQLNLDPTTESNISSDVASGRRVTVPRDPTPLNDWIGVGYITEVPSTGEAGYIISGGLASASDGASSGAVPPAVASGGAVTVILSDGTVLVIPAGQLGDFLGSGLTGDPVNIANGNFFRHETDFSIPALEEPLAFTRYYNSQSTFNGPLGPGWTHSYSELLVPQPNNDVIWIDGHGTAFTFVPDVNPGTFVSPPGLRETLVDTGGGFTLTRYDGLVEQFDATGKLASRTDRNGNAFSFGYDVSGRLSTVTDPASRALTLAYNAGDHIQTVADFTGRTWNYTYDGSGRLAQVTSPSDANTPAMVTQYTYDGSDRLATITEPNGGVREIHYYANGRVAEAIDPLGHPMSLVYNPFKSETRVTDARGFSEIHGFNAAGNPDRITHSDGTVDTWTWVDNRMTSHTDPLGATETFEYDTDGNLHRTVDALSRETVTDYDPTYSNPTHVVMPVSRAISFGYDGSGNVNQITDPEMGVRSMVNNAQGLPTSITDARNVVTSVTYEADGQVNCRTSTPDFSECFTYDPRGTKATRTDGNSHTTSYGYDLLDRTISVTDPEMHGSHRTYDAAGRLIQTTDARGSVTQYEYDLDDRLVRQIQPDGSARAFQYDETGHLTVETDELGRSTRYAYDGRGRRIRITYPDGAVVTQRFDANGRMVSTTDPLGNETRFEYDAVGHLVRSIDALGHDTTRVYNASGTLDTLTDRRGAVTQFSYDNLLRITQVDGEEGRLQTFDYDGNGSDLQDTRYDISNVSPVPSDPRTLPDSIKRKTISTYDDRNRVSTRTDPEGGVTGYSYDAAGNVLTVTDPRSKITTYEYTPTDRVSKVIAPDTGQTAIDYDSAGNRIRVTTPTGGIYRWTYDNRNRIATYTDPLGQVTTFEYDLVGNVTRETRSDGTWVRRTYDPRNRPVLIERSDGTWTARTYDLAGNLVRARTEATDLTHTYDTLNRLHTETLAFTGTTFSKTVTYQYDEESNLVSVTDPEGRTLSYGYDLAEQLDTVSSTTQGLMVQIGQDGYGERGTIDFGNGRSGTLVYDKDGRPTNIDWTASVLQAGYFRDPAGNPTQIQEMVGGAAETLDITYDDLGRPILSTATNSPSVRSESFAYDLSGNPTNPGTGVTTTFNAANQPVSSGTTTFSYDARGNRTAAIPSSGPAVETIHDPANRPVTIREGASETDLVYDGLDRVVEMRDGGTVTRLVYAGSNRLCTYDGTGSVMEQYTSGPKLDDVFAVEKAAGVFYLHRDALGSIRAVTDGSGTVAGTRAYGLFGRLQATTGSDGVGLGFTGRPFYLGGDLVDLRARLYDPKLAAFLAVDPLGVLSSFPNPYAYAKDRPTLFVDPLGLSPQDPSLGTRLLGVLGALGGVADITLGVLGLGAPTGITQVLGVGLIAYGADSLQASLRQIWTGEYTRTEGSQAISGVAELLGADPSTSVYIGDGVYAGVGIALNVGTAAGLANSAGLVGGAAETGSSAAGDVGEGTRVWRVWGDEAGPAGHSWTTVDPSTVSDYRSVGGLPTQNTGRFVSEAVITDATGVSTRSALPLAGNPGGLPEVLIPDPATQLRLINVSGVNPPF